MAKVVDILTRNELDTIRDNIDLLCDTICRITNKHTSGEDLIVKRCFADPPLSGEYRVIDPNLFKDIKLNKFNAVLNICSHNFNYF